jgi:hypothetical protein
MATSLRAFQALVRRAGWELRPDLVRDYSTVTGERRLFNKLTLYSYAFKSG